MIEIKNLHKQFNDKPVLVDINLSVPQGQILTIIGPSGSGKSTLLRCINLLEQPNKGEITIDEEIVSNNNIQKIRQKVGMVFQHFNLFPHMTVLQNITYAPKKILGLSETESKKRARALLKLVGLTNFEKSLPNRLSGGQKQRVAIARALIKNPSILILDDCLSAVDANTERTILGNLDYYIKDKTTLFITHRIFYNFNFDLIIYLQDGKIAEQGTHDSLLAKNGFYAELYRAQQSLDDN
jgi:polar amino acid transport system ATP-binding protein